MQEQGDHWIIPCIGDAIFAFGNASIYGLSLTYLVDCYREVRAVVTLGQLWVKANAANLRLAIAPWIRTLGFHDTFTSAGCLALAVALLCVPMIIRGKHFRSQCAPRYRYFASHQFDLRRTVGDRQRFHGSYRGASSNEGPSALMAR